MTKISNHNVNKKPSKKKIAKASWERLTEKQQDQKHFVEDHEHKNALAYFDGSI